MDWEQTPELDLQSIQDVWMHMTSLGMVISCSKCHGPHETIQQTFCGLAFGLVECPSLLNNYELPLGNRLSSAATPEEVMRSVCGTTKMSRAEKADHLNDCGVAHFGVGDDQGALNGFTQALQLAPLTAAILENILDLLQNDQARQHFGAEEILEKK